MSKSNSSPTQSKQRSRYRIKEHWDELCAAFREKKAREKKERNSREMVHTLIRRHYTGIIKTLEASTKDRETFLATGFSPAQFRKAALYGMLYAARKYKPESGKDERNYLFFYARQEIRRQCMYYSHCLYANPRTGKTFCTVPAFERDFRGSGTILFQRRGSEIIDCNRKAKTGPSVKDRNGSDFSTCT